MTIKTLDSKGRVTLGARFAGQTVMVDDSDPNCIVIKTVVVIPAEEAWLYKNQAARELVSQGLDEACEGSFSESPPDVDRDLKSLGDVED